MKKNISIRPSAGIIVFIITNTTLAVGQDIRIQQLISNVSEANLIAHVRELSNAGGFHSRMNFTPGNDSARFYIEKTFNNIPGLSVEFDSFYTWAQPPFDQKPMYNILARLPGKKNLQEYVLIGGHYDSAAGLDSGWVNGWETMPAPGADDNASGVAAVLELARIFANGTLGYNNDYPIYFVAFAGEEGTTPPYDIYSSFRNGSDKLARKLQNAGIGIRGMINLDMIGYNDHCLYANIEADSQSSWLGEKCLKLDSSYQIGLTLNASPFPAHQWSDQGPFWTQGYPAILLIEHYDPTKDQDTLYEANKNFHHRSDTLGLLNPQLMKSITQLALATAAILAMDTSAATSIEDHEKKEMLSVSLEAFPNPFNPITTIRIAIPSPSVITLKIFDLLGREVANLIQEGYKSQGQFQLRWDASQHGSGVYLYGLQPPPK